MDILCKLKIKKIIINKKNKIYKSIKPDPKNDNSKG